MTASLPLPSLLLAVLSGLERAYTDVGAGSSPIPSLDLWANLLRAVNKAGIDRRELPAMLRLSKRAVRSRVSLAARHGLVEELKASRGGGIVHLTLRGSDIAARWKALQQTAEERWQATVGTHWSGRLLRASLEDLVAALPLEHPHYPASYGAADASITGGNGEDWKAVPRVDGDTVSDLPLSALISETPGRLCHAVRGTIARCAFAQHRRDPADSRRGPAATRTCHLTWCVCAHSSWLRAREWRQRKGDCIPYPRGLEVHCAYEQRIHAVETSWREKFGNDRVTALLFALDPISRP